MNHSPDSLPQAGAVRRGGLPGQTPGTADNVLCPGCGEAFHLHLDFIKPGIAEKAADQIRKRFPHLQVIGTHHGYFDKTLLSAENEAVIQGINAAKPNILIVGLGMPLQERWLFDNWERLDVNVALTGGAVFDYVSGELRRGPKWMTDNGDKRACRIYRRIWKSF